jgi:hypothetical protein
MPVHTRIDLYALHELTAAEHIEQRETNFTSKQG